MEKSLSKKSIQATLIEIKPGQDVQLELDKLVKNGCKRIKFVNARLKASALPAGRSAFAMLVLDKRYNGVEIEGADGDGTILDAEYRLAHGIVIESGVRRLVLRRLIITHGQPSHHNAMQKLSPWRAITSIYRYVDGGGVVALAGAEVAFDQVHFVANRGPVCGAAVSNQGARLTFDNCYFVENLTGDTGAAIDNLVPGSQIEVQQCRFEGNLSTPGFGVISLFPDTFAQIEGCSFYLNRRQSIAIDYQSRQSGLVAVNNQFIYDKLELAGFNPVPILPEPKRHDFLAHLKVLRFMVVHWLRQRLSVGQVVAG